LKGRLVATYDRASLTVASHDGRGRTPASLVRIAKPGPASDALATRYAERWYQRDTRFDSADRELAVTTGATVTELQGTATEPLTGSTSAVRTSYTKRGTVKDIGGSYGSLVSRVERTADGLVQSVHYGDAAETTTDFSYDVRRRVKTVQTYRGPPAGWNAPNNQPTFQLLLQDDELSYDGVSNPVEIRDWRIASEWPAGAKPVTKKAQYDDLNRVARVDYQFEGGDDAWKSPFDAENSGAADLQDPRRAKPSPHVSFDKRLLWQTFEYDWVGNTKKTDDDAHGFYDRSLGPITNDSAKPYQLASADNTSLGGSKTGKLATRYDPAGNLTRLQAQRNGACLPTGADCSQVFGYEWDEVGRLTRARRWDVATLPAITDPLPGGAPEADLRYSYDAGDQRVLKTAVDDAGAERHTVYVFESLEIRRAPFAPGSGPSEVPDYELSKWTEVPYLYAHGVRLARVAWDEPDVPTVGGAQTHVLLELGDHLGSTSVVLDKATGELVERGTYQAYGGAESDYRPDRWKGFREDYRFTGKEEDVEVGLQYFGKRYYAPLLGRWVSADPLGVHALGGDSNLYGYVRGAALKNVDPRGLCDSANPCGPEQGAEGSGSGGPAMESEFVRWNQDLLAAQAQSSQYAAEMLESRDVAMSQMEAQAQGRATISDATPQLKAAAAKQKAAEGLATMAITTPFAPVIVSLQAATGNNEAAVVANHLGIIGGAALAPHAQPYALSLQAMQPPRASASPAPIQGEALPRGPPATRDLALQVANLERRPWVRTVTVLQTREGPTLVSGGKSDLSPAQEQLARSLGLTPAPPDPELHAEPTAIFGAGRMGLTPTRGATTNKICEGPGGCRGIIESLGGRVTGKYSYEF
jgi:RHS repeat-associated protein